MSGKLLTYCDKCKQAAPCEMLDGKLLCKTCMPVKVPTPTVEIPEPPSIKPYLLARFAALPEKEQWVIMQALTTALQWKGWDRKCHCHAARGIREIAATFERNGTEIEEYC